MTQDLFQNQSQDQQEIDPNKNYLEDYVGEGKPFKSVEDLAKGKFHADTYIQDQNRQLDEMREFIRSIQQDRQRAVLEDQLTQVRQQLASSDNTPDANEVDEKPKAFDPKDLDALLERKLSERERQRTEEANYNQVVDKLKEKYGRDYVRNFKEDVEALGLSTEYVNELARKSPKALYRTLGLDQAQSKDLFQSPPATDRRSSGFAPTSTDKRTWSFYKKLKETNPMIYLDPKTQVQMHKDRIALGDAFEDGDFHL